MNLNKISEFCNRSYSTLQVRFVPPRILFINVHYINFRSKPPIAFVTGTRKP